MHILTCVKYDILWHGINLHCSAFEILYSIVMLNNWFDLALLSHAKGRYSDGFNTLGTLKLNPKQL